MLRYDKLTVKAQEALQQAQDIAAKNGQQQIEPLHILAALVGQQDGIVPPLLNRLGVRPETLEGEIARHLPGAQQVVVVGNGRGFLSAIVAGKVSGEQVQAALDAVNPQLPHYKQVRAFCLRQEPFSIENGMLTANGKLKRDLISTRMKNEIDEMYPVKQAV